MTQNNQALKALANIKAVVREQEDTEAVEVVERLVRSYVAALEWIATHDAASVANAKRVQAVAAGALHKGVGPDVVLGKRGEA